MPEVKYRITVEGAAAAKAAINETSDGVKKNVKETQNLGDAFKAVSRDIDAVAGEAGAAFGRWTSDIIGVAEALGSGGVMAAAAGVTAAVGLGTAAWKIWKEESTRAAREADAALKTVRAEMETINGLATQGRDFKNEKNKSAAELREMAAVQIDTIRQTNLSIELERQKQAIRDQANVRLGVLGNTRAYMEESRISAQTIKGLEAARATDEADRRRYVALAEDAEAKERGKKSATALIAVGKENTAKQKAAAQDEYDELRADLKAALALRAADKKKAKEDELADDKRQAAENLAFSEEENKRERIAQATADQSMATEDLTHKKQELAAAAREQANAENRATQETGYATAAMYAQSAAMMVAQPIINEMLTSERELLMLNRDTFEEYRTQDWETLIAAKVQAIMAGIAVEATGKAIMETGEGLAAIATGTGMLMLGMPNGAGMIAAGAGHLAAASAFAGIAGVSGAGAVAVGSQRGSGGLFKTGDEKKDGMGGAAGSPAFGKGGGFGGNGGQGGGDVITVYNYEAGSVDASDRQARNRTVQAANRENARDVFAQREMRRSA
jgi:hypothetical protein